MVKHTMTLLLLSLCIFISLATSKHPVVLVPGLGVSQLWHRDEAEINYTPLWIYPRLFFPPTFVWDAMKLNVNSTTGVATDTPGHTVKACGFGNPRVVTELIIPWNIFGNESKISPTTCDGYEGGYKGDAKTEESMDRLLDALKLVKEFKIMEDLGLPSLFSTEQLQSIISAWKEVHYYRDIIQALEKKGYKVNKHIRGAPYDFRKAPDDQTTFFRKLKQLVEDLYVENNNVTVVMVGHSMGNTMLLYFFNNFVSKEWKDQYIHAYVALAPPWTGVTKSVKVMVSGDNEDLPIANGRAFRAMQRSWPAIAWLMPDPDLGLWDPEEPFVVTPNKNYSINDYRQLFDDLNYTTGYRLWQRTKEVATNVSKPPELRALHVLYGVNVSTADQFIYMNGSFPDSDPVFKNGNGDGTVNLRVLEIFKKFSSTNSTNLTHHAFGGVDHMGILTDKRVLDFITDVVFDHSVNQSSRPEWSMPILILGVISLFIAVC